MCEALGSIPAPKKKRQKKKKKRKKPHQYSYLIKSLSDEIQWFEFQSSFYCTLRAKFPALENGYNHIFFL
jgi:hypothetical protein